MDIGEPSIKLWLDDIREPWRFGCLGWHWVTTAEDAIALLSTGRVIEASLDHDLSEMATIGILQPGEKTGYTVVCWMEDNNVWPKDGVRVHSLNPIGKKRMEQIIEKHYMQKETINSK